MDRVIRPQGTDKLGYGAWLKPLEETHSSKAGGVPKLLEVAGKLLAVQGRILVMDDDRAIQGVIRKALERLGYKVVTVDNGTEALAHYREALQQHNRFDLVILDVLIPGGIGAEETMRRLLEMDGKVKAIVTSGTANSIVMTDYQDYGFLGRINKPFTLVELVRVVQEVMEGHIFFYNKSNQVGSKLV